MCKLFDRRMLGVVYATYKQGLWGDRNPIDYINLMYYLQEHGGEYFEGEEASQIVSQVEAIAAYARDGEFGEASKEMESLMASVERSRPSIFDAMKDSRRKYANVMRTLYGRNWKSRISGGGYSGADYSTYSGSEFVDMLGIGPEY